MTRGAVRGESTNCLGVGVLAGERLVEWIRWLPASLGQAVLIAFEGFHRYNPFGIVRFWSSARKSSSVAEGPNWPPEASHMSKAISWPEGTVSLG